MANFYQLEIQTLPDNSVAVGATAIYESSVEAQIAFSTKKASNLTAIKDNTLKACLIHTFGPTGVCIPGMNEYLKGLEDVEPQEGAANYYQLEVQTLNDGTVAVGATAAYVENIDAEIAFNTKKASNLTAIYEGNINACLIHTFTPEGVVAGDMNEYLNNIPPVENDEVDVDSEAVTE